MKIYMNGKKVTKKEAENAIGKERLEARIEEAREALMMDPYEVQSWMDGMEITM